jgi:RNA polymerase sigma-70 factor (ECF subfamily)
VPSRHPTKPPHALGKTAPRRLARKRNSARRKHFCLAIRLQNRAAEAAMDNDDRQLVLKARSGDDAAFRTLLERTQRRAFKVALGIVRDADDAKEVCQEAFLRVHRNLADFDERAQFTTWLHRIVVNLSIDLLRRRRTVRLDVDAAQAMEDDTAVPLAAAPIEFDPARNLANRELREQLQAALSALSPAHRTILVLREIEDLSYKEIAQ